MERPECDCAWFPGHRVYHCVHWSIEHEFEKARARFNALPEETKQRIVETINDIINNPE